MRWIVEVHTEVRKVASENTTTKRLDRMLPEKLVVELVGETTADGWKVDGREVPASHADRQATMRVPSDDLIAEAAKRGALLKHEGSTAALVRGAGVERLPVPKLQRYQMRALFTGRDNHETAEEAVLNANSYAEACAAMEGLVMTEHGAKPYRVSVLAIEDLPGGDEPKAKKRRAA
jgi:hypothetical protein